MTESALDRRPARKTAVLAGAVALAAAALVGGFSPHGIPTALALLGVGLLAGAAWAIDHTSRRRQAAGSAAAVVGAVTLFGAFLGAIEGSGLLFVSLVALGVGFVLVDAAVGIDRERERTLSNTLRENGNALLLGIVLTAVVNLTIAYGVVPALLGGLLTISTYSTLFGFVTLQIYVLTLAVLLPKAAAVLSRWLTGDPERSDGIVSSMAGVGLSLGDVPRIYWLVLIAQLLVAVWPSVNEIFETFFGDLLAVPFRSGVLHGTVGLAIVALVSIILAGVVQRWAVTWFGDDPGDTLATQAGAIGITVLAVLATVVLSLFGEAILAGLVSPSIASRIDVVGVPAVTLGALALVVLVVLLALNVPTVLSRYHLLPAHGSGFALGSALLFLAVLVGVGAGVPAVVTFVGVAAAIFVWDVGAHSTSIGRQLGQAAETSRSEFVHATGTGLVLLVAVALATLARYVVVPAVAPAASQSMSGPAAVSLVLVLVAILAFVAAVHLRERAVGR